MTEGQRFEAQPLAELVAAGIYAQQQIFMSDAVLPFPIYARLIGTDHARLKCHRV